MRLPRKLPFKGLIVERGGASHAFDLGFLAEQAQFDPEEFHRLGCQDISDRRPNDIRLKQRMAAHPGPGTWQRVQRQLVRTSVHLGVIEQGLLRPPVSKASSATPNSSPKTSTSRWARPGTETGPPRWPSATPPRAARSCR